MLIVGGLSMSLILFAIGATVAAAEHRCVNTTQLTDDMDEWIDRPPGVPQDDTVRVRWSLRHVSLSFQHSLSRPLIE